MSNPPRRRSQPRSDLTEEQITSIKETFAMFDPEKTGRMASKDLKVTYCHPKQCPLVLLFPLSLTDGHEGTGF